MQACITKFFKPLDPSKVDQYHEWLFEKEKADREKRIAEREAKIKQERDRLRQIQREKEKKRREALKLKAEEKAKQRAELARRKLEGQYVVPGVFVGGRLAAQNWEWLISASNEHKLSSILNATPNIRNYYSIDDKSQIDEHDGSQELVELSSILENVGVADAVESNNTSLNNTESKPEPQKADGSDEDLKQKLEEIKKKIYEDSKPTINDTDQSRLDTEADKEGNADEDDDEFLKQLEGLDDEEKLKLLESIKLNGEEESSDQQASKLDPLNNEPVEEVEDEAKKLLEKHKAMLEKQSEHLSDLSLTYFRIPIEDDRSLDIYKYFQIASDYIKSVVDKGEAVLVHCREGRSRSVSMVVAYLILGLNMTLRQSIELIKTQIPDNNINDGFKKQLMDLDFQVHGSHSIDFFDRTQRKATINPNYTDNISEITGAPSRSKRPRRSCKASADDMDPDMEFEPPTKIPTNTSTNKRRNTNKKSTHHISNTATITEMDSNFDDINNKETRINETPINETPINETPINETPINETPINETTTQIEESKMDVEESIKPQQEEATSLPTSENPPENKTHINTINAPLDKKDDHEGMEVDIMGTADSIKSTSDNKKSDKHKKDSSLPPTSKSTLEHKSDGSSNKNTGTKKPKKPAIAQSNTLLNYFKAKA